MSENQKSNLGNPHVGDKRNRAIYEENQNRGHNDDYHDR